MIIEDDSDVVWGSVVTKDMVNTLSESDISNLINQLDRLVQVTCQEYGVK